MSVTAMAWAKQQRTGSASAKLVLMVLADYADEHGLCWPARSTISSEAEISLRCVSDQMRTLEGLGLIRCEARNRENGSRTSNEIQLRLSATPLQDLQGAPAPVAVPPLQNLQGGLAPFAGEPLQDLQGAPAPVAVPEPPLKPPVEPPTESLAGAQARGDGGALSAVPKSPPATIAKHEPWARDAEFAALWDAATPEMRRRAKSKAKVWPEWVKARRLDEPSAILGGMLRYLERDPDVKRTGGPGLHLWLRDRTFEVWAEPDSPAGMNWPATRWAAALEIWRESGRWDPRLGPEPGQRGCNAPAEVLGDIDLPALNAAAGARA